MVKGESVGAVHLEAIVKGESVGAFLCDNEILDSFGL